MSWLNGVYTRIHNWVDDEASEIDIEASRMDAEDDSIAAGINDCLKKDGTNSATLINIDNLRLDGNTLSSTDTDGNIELTPNGAGLVNIAKDDLAIGGVAVTATAAELNLLDGVTRVGDVVSEESFPIGGDFSGTGYAKKETGVGGDWVTVWLPAMSHSANSQPSSAAGDLPSAYRPSLSTSIVYLFTPTYVAKVDISTISAGSINFEYRNWAGTLVTNTTTNRPTSLVYFVPD